MKQVFQPLQRKHHSLTGRITLPLAFKAFKAVQRNRGAAGIDRVSLKMFAANLDDNLSALVRQLKDRSFQPRPLRRHFIPKGDGQMRPLGIPAVRDRVAQEILRSLLDPIFEPQFHPHSFGFRAGRNCHQALRRAIELHDVQDLKWVLDADIQGFFDHLPHRVIMQAVAAQVADGNILRLIEDFLSAGVMDNGVFKPTAVGTPQGGVISPLLANIVLHHLDATFERAGLQFVRYADDFIVIGATRQAVQEANDLAAHTLGELGLTLSPSKTTITTYGKGYSFLGFVIQSRSKRMRPKSWKKFQDKVRELTPRKHNLDAACIDKLNRVIAGTARYFATEFFTAREVMHKTDSWIRMRLRAMKYKRKSRNDNWRMRNSKFEKLGLLRLEAYCDG